MSYTLWHGDCLEEMDRIESGSVDMILAGLSTSQVRIRIPLSFYVASMTKAYQVFKSICLAVISKIGKANYMMNVKFFTIVLLTYTATLAGVIISFSSKSPLPCPVATVVTAIIATLPIVMILTTMPSVSTVSRAESKTTSPLLGFSKGNNFVAILASKADCWRGNRSGSIYKFFSSGIFVTFLRTKGVLSSGLLKRLAGKYRFAIKTFKVFIDLSLLTTQDIGACTATGGLSAPLKALGVCQIRRGTYGAHLFYHKDIIPLVWDKGKSSDRLARIAAELRGELNHLPMFAEAA